MFIDDLASIYIGLEKIKPTLEKVSQRQKKSLEQLNQNIFITDLIVRTPFEPYGERESTDTNQKRPTRQRLHDHLTTLFAFANEYHGAINCDRTSEGYQLKENKKNNITRLSTPEFSFYTQEALTLDEFQSLLDTIEQMASKLTPNVHVLLSSFAVNNKDGKLLNMSLYVEGGNPPELHVFSKNTAASNDVHYAGVDSLFAQQRIGSSTLHADQITSKEGFTISTGSVFEVKTKGGACYTQTIDICFDHKQKHSKELITRRILSNVDEILPNQIEQCVSSNVIDLYKESIISNYCVHVDLNRLMQFYGAEWGLKVLSKEAKQQIIPNGYPGMSISEIKMGYLIANPSFGSDCYIEVLSERSVGKYIPSLQTSVNQHNQEVHAKQLSALKQRYLGQSDKGKAVLHIEQSKQLLHRIEELEKKLLKRCKPTILQDYFKTEEYKQKLKAKKIITSCIKHMKDAINLKGNASVLLLRSWKKDFSAQIDSIGLLSGQFSLKRTLKKDINEAINKKLAKDLECDFERPEQIIPKR